MIRSTLVALFLTMVFSVSANQWIIDSLKNQLKQEDSKYQISKLYLEISEYMYVFSTDSMYFYSQIAYDIAQEELNNKGRKEFDLIKAYAINNIGSYYNDIGKIDTALLLYEQAFWGFKNFDEKEGMAIASNNIGYIYNNFKVDIPKAIYYYQMSIDYLKELESGAIVASLLNNLAYVYDSQGDYTKALELYFEALTIRERVKDSRGLGEIYNNIGAVYQDLEDVELAKQYYIKSLEVRAQIPDSLGISYNYNNLGSLYMNEGDYKQSLQYHRYALNIRQKIKRPREISQSLSNIGLNYIYLNQFDSAQIILLKALEINRSLGEKEAEAATMGNLALMSLKKGDRAASLIYARKSYQLASQKDYDKYQRTSAELLYQTYKQLHQPDSALKYHEIYTSLKDSMLSTDNIKESIKLKTRYEIEREELIKKQQEKEAEQRAAQKKSRRNSIQYTLILIGLLVLTGVVLSIGMIQVTERQAQGLIFLTFLIFFEFLLVVMDPYVDLFSGGAPIIKLAVNASVAALIFPMHSYLEKLIKQRILNKKDKLAKLNQSN
jgi:tetratricopeptide (TPR) repeat protein